MISNDKAMMLGIIGNGMQGQAVAKAWLEHGMSAAEKLWIANRLSERNFETEHASVHLIRAMGGYFVRRDSANVLYRWVLECYVQMAAEGGVPQAVFPEGRLSRDGKINKPRLGLLGYMTRGFDPDGTRDIVFIPVGINYDRVIEDRSLLRSASQLPPRSLAFSLRTLFIYSGKILCQSIRGKRYRNGYACVNFGEPVSLRDWMKSRNLALGDLDDVGPLADDLMQRVGNITPILPVALVTTHTSFCLIVLLQT